MLCTELITNNAAAVLMFPIALERPPGLECSPTPFVIAVMIAASASFLTPFGYQTNMMVYGVGGYRVWTMSVRVAAQSDRVRGHDDRDPAGVAAVAVGDRPNISACRGRGRSRFRLNRGWNRSQDRDPRVGIVQPGTPHDERRTRRRKVNMNQKPIQSPAQRSATASERIAGRCDARSTGSALRRCTQRSVAAEQFQGATCRGPVDASPSGAANRGRPAHRVSAGASDQCAIVTNWSQLIRERQVIVVCGETGSGKSTQLPKFCLEAGLGREAMIGHTQPRRLAARSIASRLAEEMETPLGQVGRISSSFRRSNRRRNACQVDDRRDPAGRNPVGSVSWMLTTRSSSTKPTNDR